MRETNEKTSLPITLEQLHAMGFENEQEYVLYIHMKQALQQKVPIGIAS